MDYDLCLRVFDLISSNGYVDKDISYMQIGGQSMNYKIALKEFMKVQKNNIWSFGLIPEILCVCVGTLNTFKKINTV